MTAGRLSGASLRFSSCGDRVQAVADQMDDSSAQLRDDLLDTVEDLYHYHSRLRDDVIVIEEPRPE